MATEIASEALTPIAPPPAARDPRVDQAVHALSLLLRALGDRREAIGFEAAHLDVHQQLLALPRADGTSDAPPIPNWSQGEGRTA